MRSTVARLWTGYLGVWEQTGELVEQVGLDDLLKLLYAVVAIDAQKRRGANFHLERGELAFASIVVAGIVPVAKGIAQTGLCLMPYNRVANTYLNHDWL